MAALSKKGELSFNQNAGEVAGCGLQSVASLLVVDAQLPGVVVVRVAPLSEPQKDIQ